MPNGVVDTNNGYLKRAGYTKFTAGMNEEVRNDVPQPFYTFDQTDSDQVSVLDFQNQTWSIESKPMNKPGPPMQVYVTCFNNPDKIFEIKVDNMGVIIATEVA